MNILSMGQKGMGRGEPGLAKCANEGEDARACGASEGEGAKAGGAPADGGRRGSVRVGAVVSMSTGRQAARWRGRGNGGRDART